MSRKWTQEKLLGILAYRPFITVSDFDAADEGKRKCAIAAMREGWVKLEQRTGYFVVRLARQPENAYTRRRYGRMTALCSISLSNCCLNTMSHSSLDCCYGLTQPLPLLCYFCYPFFLITHNGFRME